jgi:hypothetical protein
LTSAHDDDDDEDDEALKQRALAQAEKAFQANQQRTHQFDQQRGGGDNSSSQQDFDDTFSLANPNMEGIQEIEQPKMLHATLKSYQLKGLRSEHGSTCLNGEMAREQWYRV